MSMAASIESRVPFLDHLLVERAASLPDEMKLRRGTTKYVLRQAMKGILPNEILTRKKMGFPVPVAQWSRGEYRHVVDEFVLGPRTQARGLFAPDAVRDLVERDRRGEGAGNHWERIWALVNLEVWQRIYLDHEPVGDITAWMSRAGGGQSSFALQRAS
jgi:asparagine synthase (glutamine-hydrolysing)